MSSEFDWDSLEGLPPQQAESPQEDFFDQFETLRNKEGRTVSQDLVEIPKALGRVSGRTATSLIAAPSKGVGGLAQLLGKLDKLFNPEDMPTQFERWAAKQLQTSLRNLTKGGDFLQESGEFFQEYLNHELEKRLGTSDSQLEESIAQFSEGAADIFGRLPLAELAIPSLIGSFLKQIAKELGAPEWAQETAEIAGYLGKDIPKTMKMLIPKTVKEKSGLILPKIVEKTEKGTRLMKPSVFPGKKNDVYTNVAKDSEKLINEIKAKSLPMSVEIEKGVDVAGKLEVRLGELQRQSGTMNQKIESNYINDYLKKTKAKIHKAPVPTQEQKAILKRINEYERKYTPKKPKLKKNKKGKYERSTLPKKRYYTPREYIQQYRNINADTKKLHATKWLEGEQKETRVFYRGLKDSISETIESDTPEYFSKLFKETNAEYHQLSKLNSFEATMERLTEKGTLDSKKLENIFKSDKQSSILKKQLGEEGHERLRAISKDLSKVKDKLNIVKELGIGDVVKSSLTYAITGMLGIPYAHQIQIGKKTIELARGYMLMNPKGFRDVKNLLKAIQSGSKKVIRKYLLELDKNAQEFEKTSVVQDED